MNKLTQAMDELFNCPNSNTTCLNSVDCEKAVRELLSRVEGMAQPTAYAVNLVCRTLLEVRFSNGQEMGYFILIRDRNEKGHILAELFSSKQFRETGKETVLAIRIDTNSKVEVV